MFSNLPMLYEKTNTLIKLENKERICGVEKGMDYLLARIFFIPLFIAWCRSKIKALPGDF
jgi:hypothetical protein